MNTLVEEKIAESIVLESVDEASRGALWLDGKVPHWYLYIDAATLNIADSDSCVIGQLEDVYPDLLVKAGGYSPDLGFDIDELSSEGTTYPYLNAAWRREILARQGE